VARIRSIKPEFRDSLTVTSWPRDVRLFFVLLWGYLDDEGRGVDEPRLIKSSCFPMDDDVTAGVVDEWLDLIAKTGTVVRYEVDGRRYVAIPGWLEHQKTQHPKPSRLPPAPYEFEHIHAGQAADGFSHENFMSTSGAAHEVLTPEQGAGSREQGDGAGKSETAGAATDASPASSSRRSPAKAKRPAKPEHPEARRLCDLLADLIAGNGSVRPTVGEKWLDAARLMIEKDHRDPGQAEQLIRWCQQHSFWRSNIESMPTFRAKYDRLRLQSEADRDAPKRRHQSEGYQRGVALARRFAAEAAPGAPQGPPGSRGAPGPGASVLALPGGPQGAPPTELFEIAGG